MSESSRTLFRGKSPSRLLDELQRSLSGVQIRCFLVNRLLTLQQLESSSLVAGLI